MSHQTLPAWRRQASRLVLDTRWYKVRQDTVEVRPGLVLDDYYVGVFPNIVLVFALTSTQEVVFVRQYKHGAAQVLVELPAGYLDAQETPLQAAKRELLEETGYRARRWTGLGFFYSNPTKEDGNGLHIFLACEAVQVSDPHPDETERIEVLLQPLEALKRRLLANNICVAGSALGIFLALAALAEKGQPVCVGPNTSS